jgi:transcription elongation GreA/GreB family factor
MNRKKLVYLLKIFEKKEKSARESLIEGKKAANQTSKSARTSWSAAGEREYSEGQVIILQKHHKQILDLKNILKKASEREIPNVVEKYCFVQYELEGKANELYLVETPTNISGVKLVSVSSPLSRALLGKKIGDNFELKTGSGKKVSGEVKYIE